MRRASLLVAAVAVASMSFVIGSACTAFPDLADESSNGLDGDGAPGSTGGGDGASDGQGGAGAGGDGSSTSSSGDGSSSAKGDASSGADGAARSDSGSATKDSGSDAGMPGMDSGDPACTAQTVDCNAPPTMACPQCSACTGKCGPPTLQPVCCVTRDGNSGEYKQCCETMGGLGNMMTCSAACN